MQLMKITISVNDKELLSFDILLLIILLVVYLFYLSIQTFYNIDNSQDTSKSVTENNDNELNVEEMKINDEKEDNDFNSEKPREKENNTTTSGERNENDKKTLESKLEKQQTQKLLKKDEEWMLIRKGKKVKSNKSKN